jgi:hypothetical protein
MRAVYPRHPLSGLGLGRGAWQLYQAAAALPLYRLRFDKLGSAGVGALPALPRPQFCSPRPYLGGGDAALGGAPTLVDGALLPAPHLDLDLQFLLTHWAAELNMSRRSDHAARFVVT